MVIILVVNIKYLTILNMSTCDKYKKYKNKYRDLKGTSALGLTTRSIGQTRTRRNQGSHSRWGRDNHSTYESIGYLRGQELQDHVMSVKDEVDQSADDVCDDIDQRVDDGLSEFLEA